MFTGQCVPQTVGPSIHLIHTNNQLTDEMMASEGTSTRVAAALKGIHTDPQKQVLSRFMGEQLCHISHTGVMDIPTQWAHLRTHVCTHACTGYHRHIHVPYYVIIPFAYMYVCMYVRTYVYIAMGTATTIL